jgi:molecular chaperone DnaK
MNRQTIDYGIDLGTTNSCLAVLDGVEPMVIKNSEDQDITPSAVQHTKRGVQVGMRARSIMQTGGKGLVTEFKRMMGTSHRYPIPHADQSVSPEQLSSEVLKAFRQLVLSKGEEIDAAVITVPAAFDIHQCDATKRAAELAGFRQSSLLTEPVAAALACGFQAESKNDYWLVYDFGGGTFDAAIVKADDGLINIVDHGGDNFLGGSDIDWAILEELVIPKLTSNWNLPDFARGSKQWDAEIVKLKWAIENAKISLSTKERIYLEELPFQDADGEEVDMGEIELNQSDVIRVAEPIIRRSIEITRKVLESRSLSFTALDRVILVGGPTKAPYFRGLLEEGFGVSLDLSVDPMTIVSRGAAVFAATQKLTVSKAKPKVTGSWKVEMKNFKPVDFDTEPMVGGVVSPPAGDSLDGCRIEFVMTQPVGNWRSGAVHLKEGGTFMFPLRAEKGSRNVFEIRISDAQGNLKSCEPSEIQYTVGAPPGDQPLIHSLGLALADNQVAMFFEKGSTLPLRKRWRDPFHTTVDMKTGSRDTEFRCPVVEGENSEAADRNRLIGELVLYGTEISRDVPSGSEVEITLRIDESRMIYVEAYFPMLDEEIKKKIDLTKPDTDPKRVARDFQIQLTRIDTLLDKAEHTETREVYEQLRKIQDGDMVAELRGLAKAAAGDVAAAEKAQSRVLELTVQLDELEDQLKWPELVARVEEESVRLEKLASEHGTPEQIDKVEDLNDQVEAIIHRKDAKRLKKKAEEIQRLIHEILFSIPEFWKHQFLMLTREPRLANQGGQAGQWIATGRTAMEAGDIDGIQASVVNLYKLLPKDVAAGIERGFGSTISH